MTPDMMHDAGPDVSRFGNKGLHQNLDSSSFVWNRFIQNYKNNLVLSFWQGKIRALLHEIADTMRTRKKKNPLRVSSNGIFCAQDRNRTCTPCGTRT